VLKHVLRQLQASLAPADTVTPFLASAIPGAEPTVLAEYVAALRKTAGVRAVDDFEDVELPVLAKCITVDLDLKKVKRAIVARWGAAACVAETPVSTPAPASGRFGGGGGGGSTSPPAFMPAGYAFKAWLRIGKVCLCTNDVGVDVAVKVTRDSRCWEHERAMLAVRASVMCCTHVVCWRLILFSSLQLAARTGVVVQLLSRSNGTGSDGLTWFALVFELLDTTVAGTRGRRRHQL
jgi:hypothetical protein